MASSAKSTALILIGSCLLACPVLFPVAAYIATGFMPRGYTSKAIIEVKPDIYGLHVFSDGSNPTDDGHFIANQFIILRSKEILYPVIDTLDLINKWSAGQPRELSREEAYVKLLGMLGETKEIRNTDMLEINVTSGDPQEAAVIANTIAIIYQKRRAEDQSKTINQNLSELQDEIDKQHKKVDEAAEKARQIRIKENIVDTNPDSIETEDKNSENPEYRATKEKYIQEKRLLDAAEQRLQTEKLEIKISTMPAKIWEKAEPARAPSTPNVRFIVLAAFGAGVLVAIPGAVMVIIGLQMKNENS